MSSVNTGITTYRDPLEFRNSPFLRGNYTPLLKINSSKGGLCNKVTYSIGLKVLAVGVIFYVVSIAFLIKLSVPCLEERVSTVIEHNNAISLAFHASKAQTRIVVDHFTIFKNSKVLVSVFTASSRGHLNLSFNLYRLQAHLGSNVLEATIFINWTFVSKHDSIDAIGVVWVTHHAKALLTSFISVNNRRFGKTSSICDILLWLFYKLLIIIVNFARSNDVVVVARFSTS